MQIAIQIIRKGCSVEHMSPRQQCIILQMVSQTEVQWEGPTLEKPPTSSRCPPVSGKYALLRWQSTALNMVDHGHIKRRCIC